MNYPENEILGLLEKLVNVNSTYDPHTKTLEMPYGLGIAQAFQVITDFCTENGLNAQVYNNQVCEIVVGNVNALRSIGILAHLDVVPVNDWTDGFKLKIINGLVYGRGVCDDKGPLVVNLIALRDFYFENKDYLDRLNFNIKLIIGGDEERGSSCLDYYFKELNKPDLIYGYTPDAEFPLVYGEKGMLALHFEGEYIIPYLKQINIDNATNVVPNRIHIEFERHDFIEEFINNFPFRNMEVSVIRHEESITFIVSGKSAHASLSEQGENAIHHALRIINHLSPTPLIQRMLHLYPNKYGTGFDPLDDPLDELGALTCNLGRMFYKNNVLSLDLDIRFNAKTKVYKFIEYLEINSYPLKLSVGRLDAPLLIDKNSPFIKTLLKAYQDGSGDYKSKPMTKGGGTYAKHAKNVVAFGSEIEGFNNHIHEANEVIGLHHLKSMYQIYSLAIKYLVELTNAH